MSAGGTCAQREDPELAEFARAIFESGDPMATFEGVMDMVADMRAESWAEWAGRALERPWRLEERLQGAHEEWTAVVNGYAIRVSRGYEGGQWLVDAPMSPSVRSHPSHPQRAEAQGAAERIVRRLEPGGVEGIWRNVRGGIADKLVWMRAERDQVLEVDPFDVQQEEGHGDFAVMVDGARAEGVAPAAGDDPAADAKVRALIHARDECGCGNVARDMASEGPQGPAA